MQVMAYIVTTYAVMAYVVMDRAATAYMHMPCKLMAIYGHGLYSDGLYSFGLYMCDLHSYDLYSHGLYSHGVCSYGPYIRMAYAVTRHRSTRTATPASLWWVCSAIINFNSIIHGGLPADSAPFHASAPFFHTHTT